jgi:hypothetical protein
MQNSFGSHRNQGHLNDNFASCCDRLKIQNEGISKNKSFHLLRKTAESDP